MHRQMAAQDQGVQAAIVERLDRFRRRFSALAAAAPHWSPLMRTEVHVHGSVFLCKGVRPSQVDQAMRPWLDYMDVDTIADAAFGAGVAEQLIGAHLAHRHRGVLLPAEQRADHDQPVQRDHQLAAVPRQLARPAVRLLDDHVLFDVVPDDIATPERLKAYRHVVRATDAAPVLPAGLKYLEPSAFLAWLDWVNQAM